MKPGRAWREPAGVLLFYAAATIVLTWPLVAHPASRLAAPVGPGDPYLNLWILGWDLRTITHDPSALLTGRIFDANIFFPAAGTLAYSDHLILQAIILWPLFALSGNLTLCYNALLFVSLLASALSMYGLARAVTGSRAGALVAGLAWAFFPFRFAHLLHLQLQSLYFLPLAFLFLHRVVAGRRRRDAIWLGVVAGLQAISSVYWAMTAALALAIGAVALAVMVGRWRSGVLLRRLVLAAVIGTVVAAPFIWPYWLVQQREGFSRNLYEASQHEAVLDSYLRVPRENLLYGRTGALRPGATSPVSRQEGPERELFPGFVLVALAAIGLLRGWRSDAKPLAVAMTGVALAGLLVSLGPDGIRSLYAFLHRFVFGFQAIRAPARFAVLVVFALGVLAAAGVRELMSLGLARGRPRLVSACLLALVGLEYVNVPLPTVAAPPASSGVGAWLRETPGSGAVVYLPLEADLGNTPAMLDSLVHGRPIVNGYSGQRPAFYMGLVDTLSRMPSADALWTLRDLGVRFVVSPTPLLGAPGGNVGPARAREASPLVERARLGGRFIYELVWAPGVEAALPRPEPPPPPDPGPMPFDEEEHAVYRVIWLTGGPLRVSAGTASITATRLARSNPPSETVDGSAGAHGYRMAIEVQSAEWVKRFFEAHDQFVTWMDADVLPSRQDQQLREGRRRLDRTTRYDHSRRTMTIGDGPALPLPRGARDALSAFLFARTLPLAAGYEARFPVVEGGRQLTATLRVTGVEAALFQGQRVEAWRAEARFESRSERRPIAATLLISRDARRVPLEIRVDAGFGSFRVELTEYAAR